MPLYEFKCRSCDHVFEKRMGVSDLFPECEECGGEVRKVFHPTPIIFKGSGWHITDYGRNGASSSKARSDSSESESEKSEPPTESKSDRDPGSRSGAKTEAPANP